MTERVEERETGGFFLNVPRKLFDPFPDLLYFRENHPDFFDEDKEIGWCRSAANHGPASCR
jgi:hypothetical protein